MSPTHVTAVPVSATANASLTPAECSTSKSLPVTFRWHGALLTESEQSPDCKNGIAAGASVTVYAASNDPSDVGPDANWIFNPDTHDPFDFIGPNGLRGFVASLGLVPLGAAVAWTLAARRARRRTATAR